MEAKVIRSEEQHQEYLLEMQRLIANNPAVGSVDAERLELLSVLVEAYENQKYPIEAPDPIDAIHFRMQEQGLRQADLVQYFGTRSRVSEVLSRKRPLTVHMIRALSVGLGISAETLVGIEPTDASTGGKDDIDWADFPVKEMMARGWLNKLTNKAVQSAEDLVKGFIADAGMQFGSAAFRRSLHGDAYSPSTKHALYAWLARVIQKARERKSRVGPFNPETLGPAFLRELVQLSWYEHGPALAVEFLEKHGIAVVVEPALRGTLLDGAALQDSDGMPVIGLTLRFDRLDNFWFTLLHEVAHLWKHVNIEELFLDNLDSSSEDRRELEANRIAKEALIPRVAWKRSDAYLNPNYETIDKLSRELRIHPSIIAGRLRKERENYTVFNDLVGHNQVRKHFNLLEIEA
ncbi:ImmA/IrrE family metallo-endopeptidase [Massilia endophytica]|uniref:ImmA/IrrE family metallo-endopeptidase n=1 Tax=Massilia endophytica TaxID=2899220 RepID=UPI001E3E6E4A|nr:ImmA/IrrE family metallo-endopeptidase [Massilia endophytica]UGQ46159.1 ImmA/IrrE family metallo-endopeptidase [Massilia endophytica]